MTELKNGGMADKGKDIWNRNKKLSGPTTLLQGHQKCLDLRFSVLPYIFYTPNFDLKLK